ncbi:HGxxPAAW family protein [Aeromicrobium sp. NPDC092404]|uniref:HGxxPAAW family protein n=1 Tax=Aeromicrobium sp. NPDC092404 TaxID=3154976 RepID=UPI0034439558
MHGSSPAAWTAVLLCLAGITIGGVALIPDPHWVWFTVGCVVTLLSGLVGLGMAAAGFGVDRAEHSEH